MAKKVPGIVLVGAGKMGAALLSGWLSRGLPGHSITVLEPKLSGDIEALGADHGVMFNPPLDELGGVDAVVLAVKPQVMDPVTAQMADLAAHEPVFLSIAAGRTIASLRANLGADAAIVRAMPNTPAAIGQGISVACANDKTGREQKALCTELLEAVGKVAWIDDEQLMDAVTAVSGSGPAYVFLLAECLARAAVLEGLPEDLAELLSRETVAGAGALLGGSDQSAAKLRENVTSPGGTTAAALEILLARDGMAPLLSRAVEAAARRSRELAG